MAKVAFIVDGEEVEPQLLFNPPVKPFLNNPTLEQLRDALREITPQEWQQNDAGIYFPEGSMVIICAPHHGYFLNNLALDAYLIGSPPSTPPHYVEVDTGVGYTIMDNYFVPFDTLWQGIEYYLKHRKLDPSLLWTQESPFPDL